MMQNIKIWNLKFKYLEIIPRSCIFTHVAGRIRPNCTAVLIRVYLRNFVTRCDGKRRRCINFVIFAPYVKIQALSQKTGIVVGLYIEQTYTEHMHLLFPASTSHFLDLQKMLQNQPLVQQPGPIRSTWLHERQTFVSFPQFLFVSCTAAARTAYRPSEPASILIGHQGRVYLSTQRKAQQELSIQMRIIIGLQQVAIKQYYAPMLPNLWLAEARQRCNHSSNRELQKKIATICFDYIWILLVLNLEKCELKV